MVYIKINNDKSVTLGSTIEPQEQDWTLYEKQIPQANKHVWDEALQEVVVCPDWLAEFKNSLLKKLIDACDKKQDDAIVMLLGYKATAGQLERYKRKYERALNNKFSADENAAIIANHEGFFTAIDNFADLIEFVRINTAALIEAGEFEKAKAVIQQAQMFDATTTLEDVQALFSGVS